VKTFLEFSGWIELDEKTQMCYYGNGDPKRITLKEWQQLSRQEQSNYWIEQEDFDVLYRYGVDSDFFDWRLVLGEKYDEEAV